MREPRAWIALAALLAVAAGAAASADELVTRDGQVIQTQGPWEVRGKLLVFKLADGTLASLRLDEADLEARRSSGLPAVPIDNHLLSALEHGLPDCSGVALGVDRLVMVAAGTRDISEVLAFPNDRA